MNNREIVKKIFGRMLVDDTSKNESSGTRMREFEIKCSSGRKDRLI